MMDYLKNLYQKLFSGGSTTPSAASVPRGSVLPQASSTPQSGGIAPSTTINYTPYIPITPPPTTPNPQASSTTNTPIPFVNYTPIKINPPTVKTPNPISNGVVKIEQPSSKSPSKTIEAPTVKEYEDKINQAINERLQYYLPQLTAPIQPPSNVLPDRYNEILNKYSIPQRQAELDKMRQTILTAADEFDKMIKDEQNVGGVREGVREARIKLLQDARDTNLQKLQLQYNFLNNLYQNSLDAAKQEMGIYEKQYSTQQSEREKAIDNTRQFIQQMISTGAIADATDDDLVGMATSLGVNVSLLKNLRKAVKTGNDLKIQQAWTNLERTQALTEKALKSPSGNTLTISEAKSLGLPFSLVGRSEAEIANEINSSNPPIWFKDMVEQKLQASVLPVYLIQKWNEFKDAFYKLHSAGGSTENSIQESDIDKLLNL